MLSLAFAALYWVLLHLGVAGPLRPTLVARLGEMGYRGVFSALSAIGLAWLALAYRGAPYEPLWAPVPFWIPAVLVLLGFVLLAYSLGPSNPTQVGAERMGDALPVAGITRITRHPMLWAFALWALAHLTVNGHWAGVLLFGAILVTALNGMVSIDRKRAAQLGPAWSDFTHRTSRLPFAAVLSGRGQLALGELAPWRLGLGIVLFVAALWLHGFL
ncbi:NnrU protein [Mycobacterium sp. KBS0706]|uniref:NnrU family protein n=1 Tax=Mycobacterium sp. KBS0706 TaxID=2578109 RepID=UPI00110FB7B2|nr:NnrU family protein [Mycobacterium sp. KBS0706]TSD84138.1 NnrU protein [Mycobacterium sp. KBS0706]